MMKTTASHEDEDEDDVIEEMGTGRNDMEEKQQTCMQTEVNLAPGTPPLHVETGGDKEEDEAAHGAGGDSWKRGEADDDHEKEEEEEEEEEEDDDDEEYAYEGNVRALVLLDVRAEAAELPIRSTVPFCCDKYGFAALVGSGCDMLDVRFAVGSDERGSERWFTERLAVETGVNMFVLKCGAPLRVERLPERFEDVPGRDEGDWNEEEDVEEEDDLDGEEAQDDFGGLGQESSTGNTGRHNHVFVNDTEKAETATGVQNNKLHVPALPLGARAFGFDMFGTAPGAGTAKMHINSQDAGIGYLGGAVLESRHGEEVEDDDDDDDNDDGDDNDDDVLRLARTMRQSLAWEGIISSIDDDDDDDDAFDDAYEDFVVDDDKNEAYAYGWEQRSQLDALDHRLTFLLAQQEAQEARMRAFVADEVAAVQAQLAEEQQEAYMDAEERLMDTNDALVETMKKFRRLVAQVQDERAPSMRRIEGKIKRRFDALERMLGKEDEAMATAERRDAETWSAAVRDMYAVVDEETRRRREAIAALVSTQR